jgi:propionyl-CoA carboxylase beta chain
MSIATDKLDDLNRRALAGGGEARQRKQHEAGKLTARERLDLLLDPGSFEEAGRLVTSPSSAPAVGDGVVTGLGRVAGRAVAVYAQDFTVVGGTLAGPHAAKICRLMDVAMKIGCPIVGLNDSGGGRIQEGIRALAGYGDIFLRNTLASGVVPQISAIMGPCAGGAVYSPSITDFVYMTSASYMFITGPDVIKAVTHETVTKAELGGVGVHSAKSGACHFAVDDDAAALASIRRLLSYLPANNQEQPPSEECLDPVDRLTPEIAAIIPERPSSPYDVRDVVRAICDHGAFLEVHEEFAANIVVGLSRVGGRVVGLVANQPAVLAGCIDVDASRKAARFVRFCDCFNIPLLTLVDVPGFLPGTAQEYAAIITHGAKLLYAFAEATVPKVTVILRKAYGGAYDVMASKHLRTDFNLSLPGGEIAVVGPEAAVNIVHRAELERGESPSDLIVAYREKFANPYAAASMGCIDEVVYPQFLRSRVNACFGILGSKVDRNPPRKHGNIPL